MRGTGFAVKLHSSRRLMDIISRFRRQVHVHPNDGDSAGLSPQLHQTRN